MNSEFYYNQMCRRLTERYNSGCLSMNKKGRVIKREIFAF